MKCKNCNANLRTDFKYCPGCGAKVVLKRITFKGLFSDFFERLLNLENNFFKTIGHLTVWPEKVITSYVDGTRRKYLNPINYLTISLALSGILLFFLRRFALDKINFDVFGMDVSTSGSMKVMNIVMEYNNFIFLLYIPIIALAGYITLNQRSYNLPEYIVTGTYILSHTSLLTFPISMIIILGFPESYMAYSIFSLLIMLSYTLYVLLRIHRYSITITLLRGFLFCALYLIGYFGLSIGINLILLLTGQLQFKDFLPPEA
ncbi:DUF3667 domain-containing protein [Lentiprolixibacter aurantiacus]|uniref:DUF3667 domain-containing protein n=1 Tax=Lentiprolixibacter aurantiacus TaxID=2993939 RepID=A0AAE3SP83_9FLAO|nr:DUF3667 domain-containing protein [Lentiprolixibacter aurantiacus]MCX2720567.1 DUF3667 domain-containing protein [Lentiprolixibacter aurantiacus]